MLGFWLMFLVDDYGAISVPVDGALEVGIDESWL